MPRYKPIDIGMMLLPIDLSVQLLPVISRANEATDLRRNALGLFGLIVARFSMDVDLTSTCHPYGRGPEDNRERLRTFSRRELVECNPVVAHTPSIQQVGICGCSEGSSERFALL
jgi:hypothetical protein